MWKTRLPYGEMTLKVRSLKVIGNNRNWPTDPPMVDTKRKKEK